MAVPTGILFDFDYTLADSSDAVVECVRVAFEKMKLPAVPADLVRRTIGLSLPETFRVLSGLDGTDQVEEFRSHFRARSNEIMVEWTRFLPDMPETIDELVRRGFRLGIVSTKYRFRIRETLGRDGLLDLFEVIVGGDDVSHYKPDPDGLLIAARQLSLDIEQLVYVGDSLADAEAAKRAGMPFVGVTTGWATRDEFAEYQPQTVLERLMDLPDYLSCRR